MLFATLAFGALSFSSVLALPGNQLDKRFTQLCGQWDTELEGGIYYLENNLWGESGYTGKTQETPGMRTHSDTDMKDPSAPRPLASLAPLSLGGPPTLGLEVHIKSRAVHANLDLQVGLKKQISTISSIPSTWKWTYTSASSDLVADVSYDLWLSTSSSGTGASSTSSYEIMIWLSSRGGAGPAGSQIGTATVNGVTWKLFKGTVSTWTVFSYVAPSEITNFSQDLLPFITYLTANQGISTSQYLVQLQAGTEPFIGSATLTTTAYSSVVNTGSSGTTTTSKTTTTTKGSTTTSKTTTKTTTTTASGAQASHYAQCGGTGYTGPTTCVSPYVCTYSNDFYSQCL
ncbi:hypothetical protein FRC04_009148 [Tulasnella sp. 424]|nr:hypothetical protein FRC04_009148 [Tulasnella sp. 424]KAG8973428.1 hypothetical protein FRC05_008819 [Tulasnella sp. 425]